MSETEADMLTAIAGGDTDALSRLYDRCAPRVYGLALRLLGRQADAEEVVQLVFIRIWEQAARYDPERAPGIVWLLHVTRNLCIDLLRQRKKIDEEFSAELDLFAGPIVTTLEALERADTAARVRGALSALPAEYRVPIELSFYEGQSHRAISETLGVPFGTVKTRIRRGLDLLRDELGQRGFNRGGGDER